MGYAARFFCMAAVGALCILPLRLCYGRLDDSRVPEALARYAVPAYRYELAESVYTAPRIPELTSYALNCYDLQGRLLLTATEEGISSRYHYSADGRLLREDAVMLGEGSGKTYVYDRQGRLLRVTADYGGWHADYSYGPDGAVTQTESGAPDASGSQIGTEAAGAQSQTIDYEYDEMGRIRTAVYTDGGGTSLIVTNVYQSGRLVEERQEFRRTGACLATRYIDVTLR